MKKGILVILVLAAWIVLKNLQSVTAFANNNNSIDQKAILLAKHVQHEFFSFTTVHLSNIKIKTNSCKQTIKKLPLQACREAQRINHETLLTINSLKKHPSYFASFLSATLFKRTTQSRPVRRL